MHKKANVIAVILTICAFAFGVYLYSTLVYMRTPKYIHQKLTPPYEAAAREFYEANCDILHQLPDVVNQIELDSYYYYAFHDHTLNSTNIPKQLLVMIEGLESSTSNNYSVSIRGREIIIFVESSTCFDVYLYYGYPVAEYHTEQEWSKSTLLENGWSIEAPCILRG